MKLPIEGNIYISHGVLRELILSRGWTVNEDSIGTVWMCIYKLAHELHTYAEEVADTRIKKLEEKNAGRRWTKDWITISKKFQWADDMSLHLESAIHLVDKCAGTYYFGSIYVKIRGNSKTYKVETKKAINTYINKELEKTLK